MVQQTDPQVHLSPMAGKPATKDMLVDVANLEREYYERKPDVGDPNQMVSFGTSGHRGTPFNGTFTEAHILAITQAICEYRREQGIDGPLLHGQGHARAVRVRRSARRWKCWRRTASRRSSSANDGFTPTPVISRAILVHNRGRKRAPGRRHRHHAVAQSAGGRRIQIQPAERRPGGHRRHQVDSGARQ